MADVLSTELDEIRRQLREADIYFSKNKTTVVKKPDGITYTVTENWDVSVAKRLINAWRRIKALQTQGHEIPEDVIKDARQLDFKYHWEDRDIAVRSYIKARDKSCSPYYKQYFIGFREPAEHLSILDIGGSNNSRIRESLLERMVQRIDYTRTDMPPADSQNDLWGVGGVYEYPKTAEPYSIGEELVRAEQERLKEMEDIGCISGFQYHDPDNINLHQLRQGVLRRILEGTYSRHELSMFWDARDIPYPFDSHSFDEVHCHMINNPIVSSSGPHYPSIDEFVAEIARLSHMNSRFFFTVQESNEKGQFFLPNPRATFGRHMDRFRKSFERQGFEVEEFKVQEFPIGYGVNSLVALTGWCYFTDGLLIAKNTSNQL